MQTKAKILHMKPRTFFLLASVILCSTVVAFSRGGHGGGGGDRQDRDYGGSTQSWCDIDPARNGSQQYFVYLRSHPETQLTLAEFKLAYGATFHPCFESGSFAERQYRTMSGVALLRAPTFAAAPPRVAPAPQPRVMVAVAQPRPRPKPAPVVRVAAPAKHVVLASREGPLAGFSPEAVLALRLTTQVR